MTIQNVKNDQFWLKIVIMLKIYVFILGFIAWFGGFAQPQSASDVKPLSIGDSIPSVSIKDLESNVVGLREIIKNKTAIIIFFRGGWCPFCNTHLSNLQEITRRLKKRDVPIVAISGEGVESSKQTKEKNSLSYQLYSDTNLDAASSFHVAFLQNGNWKLPVPSVFIADKNGIIRFVHFDPNYQVRMDAEEILLKVDEIIKLK